MAEGARGRGEGGGGERAPTFGALLRAHRRTAGLTQETLAERAGLSRRGLQHLEAGDTHPYPATLDALVAALDLAPEDRHWLRSAGRRCATRSDEAAPPRSPGRRTGPAASTSAPGPTNLPAQLTSFVGRGRDLIAVREALGASRLVTLTGAGGVGKTRLALQVAVGAPLDYPDGAWLVELAPLADPALVPLAVAAAVGVREQPGRPLLDALVDALRAQRLLLVLDNCEHVLDACARLAERLLRAGVAARLLCTSREALGVAGEAVWPVAPLPVPADGRATDQADGAARARAEQSAAARLFVDRAAAVRPGFALTDENAAAVAEVCRRLDGLPLALELAAARVRVLPPRQLLGRLEDRLRLLRGGSRTAPARQQTLRATLDWSYDLLTTPERALFARLSVFAGGWTLEAAEAVVADPAGASGALPADAVLDLLIRLVDQSLVTVEERPDGTARYRLHETVRQFAAEKLEESGERSAVGARHAAAYLALGEAAEPHLAEAEQAAWLDRLDAEHDNFRQAFEWWETAARSGDAAAADHGMRLAGSLAWFWMVRGHLTEGRARLRALLGHPDNESERPTGARARALRGAFHLAMNQSDRAAAKPLVEAGLAAARASGDAESEALALYNSGYYALVTGDPAAARGYLEASLRLGRALGIRRVVAVALHELGQLARDEGDVAAARRLQEQSLALSREAGDSWLMAHTLAHLSTTSIAAGDPVGARALLEEALTACRRINDRPLAGRLLEALARTCRNLGDHAAARASAEEALAIARALGNEAEVAARLQELERIARAGGADHARRRAGRPGAPGPTAGGVAADPARAHASGARHRR